MVIAIAVIVGIYSLALLTDSLKLLKMIECRRKERSTVIDSLNSAGDELESPELSALPDPKIERPLHSADHRQSQEYSERILTSYCALANALSKRKDESLL